MSKLAIAAILPILLIGSSTGAFAQDQDAQITQLREENAALQENLQSAVADRAMLLNRIERIKANSASHKAAAEENQGNLDSAMADKAMLLNRIERIKANSASHKAVAEENQGNLESATAENAILLKRIERIKAVSENRKAAAEENQGNLKTATAEKAILLKRIERLKANSAAHKAEAEQNKANLENVVADRARLLNRIERIKAISQENKALISQNSSGAADWASKVSAELSASIGGLEGTTVSTDGDNNVLVQVGNNGLFRISGTSLSDSGSQLLSVIAKELASQEADITVVGHTDDIPVGQGSIYANNEELSFARAASTLLFLSQQGIPTERLSAAGYGADYPIASNLTSEGRRQNRRVDIVLRQQ